MTFKGALASALKGVSFAWTVLVCVWVLDRPGAGEAVRWGLALALGIALGVGLWNAGRELELSAWADRARQGHKHGEARK
jgi:hypothetical protein